MKQFKKGEVWVVDLGMAAKIRPCLIISKIPNIEDRAIITIIPHTTSIRNSNYEIYSNESFLQKGAFDAQNIVTIPYTTLIRKIGNINQKTLSKVESKICDWLDIKNTE